MALVPGVLEQLETPEGLLKVAVKEAEHVPRSDLLTPPDPYVVCVAYFGTCSTPLLQVACCRAGRLLHALVEFLSSAFRGLLF